MHVSIFENGDNFIIPIINQSVVLQNPLEPKL